MPRGTWWTFAIRLFYAGAMEGQMPEILTMIQVSRMPPTPAVLCIAFLSLLYLGSDNVFSLINYVGFATWVQQLDRPERPVPPISLPHAVALFFYVSEPQLSIGAAVVCVPYLRWKRPDLERPIRVNMFFPIIYIMATVFIVVVPCIASPVETGTSAMSFSPPPWCRSDRLIPYENLNILLRLFRFHFNLVLPRFD